MNISITQGNTQENITAPIIAKMYNLAVDLNNNVTYSGNLYSPSAFGYMVDYLNTTFGPDLIVTVPISGRFINFQDSALESRIKTILGIDLNAGITEPDAADAIFTLSSFAGTLDNPNTSITSFGEFNYFTKANNNPPNSLFLFCTTLTNINFQNVTKISNYEFDRSGLRGDISIPNLISLGIYGFKSSKISSVSNLGETITIIPNYCFEDCENLISVNIPSSVTEIGVKAFCAYNYTKQLTTVTGLDNVTILGDIAFYNLEVLDLDVSVLLKVVSLGHSVFYRCFGLKGILNLPNLISIETADSLATTWVRLFEGTGITKVQCLGSISSIPANCFYLASSYPNSNKLTEVYLPYECNNIGRLAFYGNSALTTVKRYNKSLSDYAEGETPVYTNLSTLTAINNGVFYNCSLLSMNISDIPNVTSIGSDAFYNTLFGGALNSDKITTLALNCFRNTLITSVHLPALTSYTGTWSMFEGCASLTSVTCLGKLDTIAQSMFKNCTSLTEAYVPKECTIINGDSFLGCSSLVTLKLYLDSVDDWVEGLTPTYSNVSNVTSIGYNAFKECSSLIGGIDFTNVTSIGSGGFLNCTAYLFGELRLPNITSISNNTFRNCTGITKVILNSNITSIEYDAFNGCSSLQSVTGLSNSNITSISKSIFYNCTNLTSIDIDWSKITSLGSLAFYYCPIGAGLTLELNLTNQNSHFSAALRGTKFDRIILHCSSEFVGDANMSPFSLLPDTTYLDLSDFVLFTQSVNKRSQSQIERCNSLVTVVYPPSVNFIYYTSNGIQNAAGTLRYMIILNETPPELNVDNNWNRSRTFLNNIVHIYVPDSAVSAYLSDSNWSLLGGNNGSDTISLRLHGLSELPAGVWTTGLASLYLTQALLATS